VTARQWAGCLVVVAGAAARELGWLLLCAADVMDPPQVPPRVRAVDASSSTCPDTVPEAWRVTW
jgi:hypothetical protein